MIVELPWRYRFLAKAIYTTIRPEFMVPTDLFLFCAHDYSTKVYGPLSLISSFVPNHLTKNWTSLTYLFYLYSTIRPKIRILINLFLFFVHDHSTKN